ncbi:NAD-dependent epimerase/dehydratase family protein [Singulisphaera acidiphila]|uniref:Nucleoside-diphosphate-sugar epimerase n=1 Tax=Singulisphaera acidiphila (strain ATCC BAA-1392 / DSM 18658 / VKM B-2454 / MOB10) TaxID=886293 RepID=L0DFV1_SINAD|nr:NAD-dependent epimerase/dehydratase family protein [Singulisphaera acidiphila]AGA28137.1 nucleoside-diphosphate-sugar epimerase [Singulisphaera acidiphila DSM 18658]
MSEGRDLVCLTGANGGLGRALADRLADASIGVVGTSLHGPAQGRESSFQRFVAGDVTEVDWPRVIAGCSAVFHFAAFVHKVPRTAEEERRVYAINAEATARLAVACREAGTMLVFASTVAVFGPAGRRRLGIESPVAPVTPYGISKWQSETAIQREGEKGLRFAILRFPLLYGPHGRGNMERLLRAIARGRYWPIGDPGVKKSCLFLADAAEAAYQAWQSPHAQGKTFIVAPGEAPTLAQIHEAAYHALGRAVPRPRLPRPAVLCAAGVADLGVRILGRSLKISDRVRTLTEPSEYDGSPFAAATGFRPAVTIGAGVAETLRWLQSPSSPSVDR